MTVLLTIATGVAVFLSALFLVNLFLFRKAPACSEPENQATQVSVLIPARNEEARIATVLETVLANRGVQAEILVFDDESNDRTAEIVREFSEREFPVRLLSGQPKPEGWCGKQFACHQLANAAEFDELIFLDADVTLTSDALRRAIQLRRFRSVALLSGFPRQETGSWGEAMLIPLIPIVLLCFLPFVLMRFTRMRAAAAGCGQFFICSRKSYLACGGHSLIRDSLHDGVTLPRAFRTRGYRTDCFDASDLATCRMYTCFEETWRGLLKNAHEGFARMPLLLVLTTVMYLAWVHPTVQLLIDSTYGSSRSADLKWILLAMLTGYLPRMVCCLRYDRSWAAALFFPVSLIMFLSIQWTSWWWRLRGRQVAWRSRDYEVTAQ